MKALASVLQSYEAQYLLYFSINLRFFPKNYCFSASCQLKLFILLGKLFSTMVFVFFKVHVLVGSLPC